MAYHDDRDGGLRDVREFARQTDPAKRSASGVREDSTGRLAQELARADDARRRWIRTSAVLAVFATVLGTAAAAFGIFGHRSSAQAESPARNSREAVAPVAASAQPPSGLTAVETDDAVSKLGSGSGESASTGQGGGAVTLQSVTPRASADAAKASSSARKSEATSSSAKKPSAITKAAATQHFSIAIGAVGFEPSRIVASSDAPITLTVAKGEGCAAGFVMPSLGIRADNSAGPAKVKLGQLKAGKYIFSCAMQMVQGSLLVQ